MSKKNTEEKPQGGSVAVDPLDEREQIIDPSDIGARKFGMPTPDELLAQKRAAAEAVKGSKPGAADDGDDEPLMREFLLPKDLADRFLRKLLGEGRPPEGGRSLDSALDLLAPIAGQLLNRELSKEKPIVQFTAFEREALTATVKACVELAHDLVKECMRLLAAESQAEAARQEARQQAAS